MNKIKSSDPRTHHREREAASLAFFVAFPSHPAPGPTIKNQNQKLNFSRPDLESSPPSCDPIYLTTHLTITLWTRSEYHALLFNPEYLTVVSIKYSNALWICKTARSRYHKTSSLAPFLNQIQPSTPSTQKKAEQHYQRQVQVQQRDHAEHGFNVFRGRVSRKLLLSHLKTDIGSLPSLLSFRGRGKRRKGSRKATRKCWSQILSAAQSAHGGRYVSW